MWPQVRQSQLAGVGRGRGLDDIEMNPAASGAAHRPVFGARTAADHAQDRESSIALRAAGQHRHRGRLVRMGLGLLPGMPPVLKSGQDADCSACGIGAAAYRLSLRRSIWNFASAIAVSGSDQAKPTSSVANTTPSMVSGCRSARLIRACHKPLPASKASILKPSYCMLRLRALPEPKETCAWGNECELVHIPAVLCARGDMIGKIGGVLADAGQQGRVQFGQPLQAEEIHSRHVGDAPDMHRLPLRVQYRNVNPAEVEAIAGGPDDRSDAGGAHVKPPQGLWRAKRIR